MNSNELVLNTEGATMQNTASVLSPYMGSDARSPWLSV
jgi:hypothetical protein